MPTVTVSSVRGGANISRVAKKIAENCAKELHIGILAGATYMGDTDVPAGTPVAAIAAEHEYGGGNGPARPVQGPTAYAQKAKWLKILKRGVKGHIVDGGVEDALHLVGEVGVKDMVHTIETMTEPALSPETVEKKKKRGRANPEKLLVDSGTMEEAYAHEVVPVRVKK